MSNVLPHEEPAEKYFRKWNLSCNFVLKLIDNIGQNIVFQTNLYMQQKQKSRSSERKKGNGEKVLVKWMEVVETSKN